MKNIVLILVTTLFLGLQIFQDEPLRVSSTGGPIAQATPPVSVQNERWVAPTVLGLKLGTSTRGDVIKSLGKPWAEGPNVEKAYERDEEDEMLLQYNDVGEVSGSIDVVIGKKSWIVKAIAVYPQERLTRKQILEKYGQSYFEIDSSESMCRPSGEPAKNTKDRKYPIVLVYPQKGMYVLVNDDDKVNHIGYGMKCGFK